MVDDRLRELLDRLAAGTLSSDERETLDRLVETDDEARACRDNVLLVSRAMKHIPSIEPPADIRQSVFEAIRPNRRAAAPGRSIFGRLGNMAKAAITWRQAYAFGAGVVCGLLVLAMATDVFRMPMLVNPRDVAGTLSDAPAIDALPPASAIPFTVGAAAGELSIRRLNDLTLLQAKVVSPSQITMEIAVDTADLAFAGFWKPERFAGEFSRTAESTNVRLAADAEFSLAFIDKTPAASVIRCRISSGTDTMSVALPVGTEEQ